MTVGAMQRRGPADGIAEMTWQVVAAGLGDMHLVIMKERFQRDGSGTEDATVARLLFRLHLDCGITYLAASRELRGMAWFVALERRG